MALTFECAVVLRSSKILVQTLAGRFKKATIELHQATDRHQHIVLLVCTFDTPPNHKLAFQPTQVEGMDLRYIYVWPRETKGDRTRIEKLKNDVKSRPDKVH